MHLLWSCLDCHRFALSRWPCRRGGSCCLVTMPHEQADFPLAPFPKSGFLPIKAFIQLYLFMLFPLVCEQSNPSQGSLRGFMPNLVGKILWSGMHDIGFFADIWYFTTHLADNRYQYQYMYIFPHTPNCRDHQVSSVVEFTYSIIMHTYTVLARPKMQASRLTSDG